MRSLKRNGAPFLWNGCAVLAEYASEWLRYMIESEKAYNRKKNHGDLGVWVQTSGIYSDITADTAISNVITRDVIIACDFSGDVLEGVDRGENIGRMHTRFAE